MTDDDRQLTPARLAELRRWWQWRADTGADDVEQVGDLLDYIDWLTEALARKEDESDT